MTQQIAPLELDASSVSEMIPKDELQILRAAGYGRRMGPGRKAALLVVDFTYGFCGPRDVPLPVAIDHDRRACGEAAWRCVEPVAHLLTQARASGSPVAFSRMRDGTEPGFVPGLWALKNHRAQDAQDAAGTRPGANEIVEELQPLGGEYVLSKDAPSMFNGTNLLRYLTQREVDTVVVCGGVTSGCVYATVLDAFSYGLRPIVVIDGTFDRSVFLHQTFLFDISMKYGDVTASREAGGLFAPGQGAPAEGR